MYLHDSVPINAGHDSGIVEEDVWSRSRRAGTGRHASQSGELTPRKVLVIYRLKKRACNCTPSKIQTVPKNSNSVCSEHWSQAR